MRPPNRYCNECGERLPYAAASCHRCGRDRYGASSRRSRIPLRHWLLGLTVAALIAVGLYAQNRVVVAENYAAFAAEWLPTAASSFAPAETEEGAFYFCIRRVAKQLDSPGSVETFPSQSDATTTRIEESMYRVRGFVDQARQDGREVRRHFTCTAAYARGHWQLHELALDEKTEEEVRGLARN